MVRNIRSTSGIAAACVLGETIRDVRVMLTDSWIEAPAVVHIGHRLVIAFRRKQFGDIGGRWYETDGYCCLCLLLIDCGFGSVIAISWDNRGQSEWERIGGVDPVTMIVTALATGAAKGVGEGASTAVADAYRGLKAMVARRFGANAPAEVVLAQYESDSRTWQLPLAKLLVEAGADRDEQILAAARWLLELSDSAGGRAGKYTVDARGANIGNVGDLARQNNTFGAAPASPESAPAMRQGRHRSVQW